MAKRICIVDDQPSLRQMVRYALHVQGFEVLEAEDGVTALDLIAKQEVDLLIIDWQMPNMNGMELLRRLRKTDRFAALPVIMVSCRDDMEARKEARKLGTLAWLKKPFRISELQHTVARNLDIDAKEAPPSRQQRVNGRA